MAMIIIDPTKLNPTKGSRMLSKFMVCFLLSSLIWIPLLVYIVINF